MSPRLFVAAASVAFLAACGSSLKDAESPPPAPAVSETPATRAGASRGKPDGAARSQAANTPSCPEGSRWNGERCAGAAVLTPESLGPEPSGPVSDSGGSGRQLETLVHENSGPSRPPPAPIPDNLGTGPLAGAWVETFTARQGCSDKIYIRQEGAELQLIGADCNDGERYAYDTPRFAGNTLTARATIPSSGYVITYTLRVTRAGELKGKAEVSGGGSKNTYDVTWTRGAASSPPRAPAPPVATAPQGLDGVWLESFGARAGCSDKVAIQQVGTSLRFSGADCNRGDPYLYSQATYDGITLSVKATVPSTGYVIQYTLRVTGPGELKGKATVTGGGATNTRDVTWRRQN